MFVLALGWIFGREFADGTLKDMLAVPGIFAQAKDAVPPISILIAVLTGLVGMAGTYLWWKFADQRR